MTVDLDATQAYALTLVSEGRNVFLTGPAGTGKSYVLSRVLDALRARYCHDEAEFRRRVAVTAPTGAAATLLGGQTINSALGVGAPSLRRDFRSVLSPRNRPRVRQGQPKDVASAFDVISKILRTELGITFKILGEASEAEGRLCCKPSTPKTSPSLGSCLRASSWTCPRSLT